MRSLVLALAIVLLCAAPAYAGSEDSAITTPSNPSFLVDDGHANMLVTGTADFNNFDIICTYGPNDTRVYIDPMLYPQYSGLHLQSGNSFAVEVPLKPLEYEDCVLHAVPTGMSNPDLSTLTGPTLSVAYRQVDAPYDFELAPLGGSIEFGESSGDGGILTSYALNPTDLSFAELFTDADSLSTPPQVDSGRASVQVDGQDAYFNSDVASIADTSPTSSPPTLNFDSTNGTGSVSSQELLGACVPGGVFPATHANCHDVVPDGVRLDHSGNLVDNGALGLVNEQFTSTDGAAHTVDVWFQQKAFGFLGAKWQFPGDPGFSDYTGVVGKSVPNGPATALLQESGPAYGSLSWSDAPDAVRFTDHFTFFMHYRFTVPAGGSHVVRFAYGSSFTPQGAAALGAEAITRWQPVVSPGGGGGGTTPPPAKLRASFGHVKAGGDGTVTLTINAPAPGTLSALETALVPRSARARTKKLTVSRASRKAARAGAVKLVLKLNAKGRKIFRAKHKLPVTLTVSYKPASGSAAKLAPRHLTLRLKKHKTRKH